MQLVMVGGQHYACVAFRNDPIKLGETIDVKPEIGEHLLKQVWHDRANNAHHYFVTPDSPLAAKFVEEAPKAKPKRRTRKKAVTEKAETETTE